MGGGNSRGAGEMLAGIIGGAVFLLFLFVLKIALWVALLAAVGAYFAAVLIINGKPAGGIHLEIDGLTTEMAERVIAEAEGKIKIIHLYGEKIVNPKMKEKVFELCRLAHTIIENLRQDPKGIKTARKFHSYYLDAVTKVVQRYVELSQTLTTPEIRETLQKAEELLDTVKSTFERQLVKLLEDEVLDLDTEIAVLEKTIQSEGL